MYRCTHFRACSCTAEVNTEHLLLITAKHHDCTEVFVGPKSTSLQGKCDTREAPL